MLMDVEFGKEIESAICWAKERLGSQEYPLRCLAFVEDAYERSNGIEMWGGKLMHANPQSCTMRTRIRGLRQLARLFFMLAQVWWTVSLRIGGM